MSRTRKEGEPTQGLNWSRLDIKSFLELVRLSSENLCKQLRIYGKGNTLFFSTRLPLVKAKPLGQLPLHFEVVL